MSGAQGLDNHEFKGTALADLQMRRGGDVNNVQFNTEPWSVRPSMQIVDDNGISPHFAYPELYRAVTAGDIALFQEMSGDQELANFLSAQLRSPRGDTVLHIAAQLGHDQLVRVILGRQDLLHLIRVPNCQENLPLFVAASAGNLSTVKVIISAAREAQRQGQLVLLSSPSAPSTGNDVNAGHNIQLDVVKYMLRFMNKERNSPLHLALSNRHEHVARFLFEQESDEVTHSSNAEGKSPLFMAAEASFEVLFETMMKKPVGSDWTSEATIKYRTDVVLGAISAKNNRMLSILLRDWPEVFTTNYRRESSKHPIFFAVSIGYAEGVNNILNKFRECSFFMSRNDFNFPIHLAAINGQVEIVREFLTRCPDSRELYNSQNQNILHLAAENGKDKLVSYILKNPHLQMLINERDRSGNTPLHLAAAGGHAKVVGIMTLDSRVNLELLNNQKRTAFDVAEHPRAPSFYQRLAWQSLRHAGAPRAKDLPKLAPLSRPLYSTRSYGIVNDSIDKAKDRINTLMLVSTLIVTITFAAGLMSPGSNDEDSEPNPAMFYIFVITNTIAMYGSVSVVVILIWAQLNDRQLILASLKCALPLLGLSLAMVSLAFMAGAYLEARNISIWLANSVLVLASTGFLSLFLLLAPLYCPNTSLKHRFARYIFYYTFCLLVNVTKSPGDDN